jgi:hypothetical protein
MGLYHSVNIVYGIEIPNRTDIDDIDRALFGQPDSPDSVGYIVVGDRDQLLLATRCTRVDENAVIPLTPDFFTPPELSDWGVALHEAAVRLGLADHPAPAWLVIHNYR